MAKTPKEKVAVPRRARARCRSARPALAPSGFVTFLVPALVIGFLAGSAAVLAEQPADGSASEPPATAETREQDGLTSSTFSLDAGDVVIHLPSDLRAGDRFTGTVELRAADPAESEPLTALDVALEGVEGATIRGTRLTGRVVDEGVEVGLTLRDDGDRVLGRTVVALASAGAVDAAGARSAEPGSSFTFPRLAQVGRAMKIDGAFDGAFDGDADDTTIELGSAPATIVAESPRAAIVVTPRDPGPTRVRVRDGDHEGHGEVRIVDVRLGAGRSRLEPGETTELTIGLAGLDDLERPVGLLLVNESPAVVGLEGGDEQRLTIAPEQVGDDGTATARRQLSGRTAGGFAIDARVAVDGGPATRESIYLLSEGEEDDPCAETGEGPPASELTENEIAWLKWLASRLTPPTSLTRKEYCAMVSRLMERILTIECRSEWVLTADIALGRHWGDYCREEPPHVGEGEPQTLALEDGDLFASDKSRLEVFDADDIRRLAEQTAAHGPIGRVEYVGHGCGCQGKMRCGDGILTMDQLAAALAGLVDSGNCTIVLYSCEAGADENLAELQSLADQTGCVVKAPKDAISPWTLGEFADWVEVEPAADPTEHGSR